MSKQVLDIKQMQHLKRLGVDTDKATMAYIINITDKYKPFLCLSSDAIDHVDFDNYALGAFTLQDILDLLPTEIEKENRNYQLEMFRNPQRYFVSYYWLDNLLISLNEVEFIDAAYEMLCWCVENGYVKTNKKD